IPLPVAAGQGAEVQHSAAESPEVAQGARGGARMQILEHVVTDDEVEGGGAAVVLDPAVLPAIAAAEIEAGLETDILGPRQEALERGAQEPGAAAGVEDPAHRQGHVLGEGRDETRPGLHFPSRGDRRARIVIIPAVIFPIERHHRLCESHGQSHAPWRSGGFYPAQVVVRRSLRDGGPRCTLPGVCGVRISSGRRRVLASVAAVAAASALVWPGHASGHPSATPLALRSSALAPGRTIYRNQVYDRLGCSGGNISPALSWYHAPAGTHSFAVLMFDSDAPGGGWWHWVVFDIPAAVRSLRAGAGDPPKHLLPPGAVQVRNDFGNPGYGGPCPPPGPPHHYHVRLYALRLSKLGLNVSASPAQVAARVMANAL